MGDAAGGVSDPWVLGLAASHGGAACLMHGQRIVAAIQEERLARRKYAPLVAASDFRALDYLLDAAGIGADDLDLVVLCPLQPPSTPANDLGRHPRLASRPRAIISHHLGHAISAYAWSGFDRATVLVVDAMGSRVGDLVDAERAAVDDDGEREVVSIYDASRGQLRPLVKHAATHPVPDMHGSNAPRMFPFVSLGTMYQTVAEQVFGHWTDSGKLMGLAAHGTATIPAADFLHVEGGRLRFADRVPLAFRHADRWPARAREYADLAASTQAAFEAGLEALVQKAAALGGAQPLCYAGGVALNVVANERLLFENPAFADIFVVPAAEDAGTALGAAMFGVWQLTGEWRPQRLGDDFLGRRYGDEAPPAVVAEAAALVAEGAIVGLFQGGAEFGPRGLGHRSLIADARTLRSRTRLDAIKQREPFRPYAPAILAEHAADWFDAGRTSPESPFMLRALRIREEQRHRVPAVVHADGTGRLQTVSPGTGALRQILEAFALQTGVPILVNTSMNARGAPIVETPDEAKALAATLDLDACVIDGDLVRR